MFRRIRARRERERETAAIQRWHEQITATHTWPLQASTPQQPTDTGRLGARVDDFLPADLRVPGRDEIAGMMMPRRRPLIIDGEVRACPQCGAYRDWIILSTRDEVWLRCRAGHQMLEPRLDTAWYNRNSGPTDAIHATFEDGLKHLGHPAG
ncbi:hypothetical protein [Streptomyces sp. NPDC056244]|uniref:hypothetical protein n=1 Tax=Streptomyces sp. NPDC056244 TaxID=3345762 RepID=UPI0035D5C62B